MAEITGGELLLKCLRQEGVTVMFGILDGSFNPFLAKLEEWHPNAANVAVYPDLTVQYLNNGG